MIGFGFLGKWVGGAALALTVAAVLLVGAYKKGERDGRRNIIADIEKARVESVREKDRIDEEISRLTDDELLRRALGFVRQDP